MNETQSQAGRVVTLAVTGASGSVLEAEMLHALTTDERVGRVHLVISPAGLRVLAEEHGVSGRSDTAARLLRAFDLPETGLGKLRQHGHEDIGAAIASGSSPCDAMLVVPCSMGTLAGIAHGTAGNLIERAADVCLKERRRLVLCVRETPFNLIHLRNMSAVTEAGATVFPVIPSFYNGPETVRGMARNFAHRVLMHIGLPQLDAYEWAAEPPLSLYKGSCA